MYIPSSQINNQTNQIDKKITLESLKLDTADKKVQPQHKSASLVNSSSKGAPDSQYGINSQAKPLDFLNSNKTKPGKIPTNVIDFTKVEQKLSSELSCPLSEQISDLAIDTAEQKVSYKDMAILDYGNLACAYAVSNILNKIPEFKNVKEMECLKLSKTLTKKGFENIFNPKTPEKKEVSDFKVGDVVFFPRTTEQYGLKKMGHVGIVSKDKITGELVMVNNGYAVFKENNKYQSESRVQAIPLAKYLEEKDVSMILRHK